MLGCNHLQSHDINLTPPLPSQSFILTVLLSKLPLKGSVICSTSKLTEKMNNKICGVGISRTNKTFGRIT